MKNFLNLIGVWEAIENGFTPEYDKTTNIITTESKLTKRVNDTAMNVIMGFVHESIALVFCNATNAKEMWDALVNKYEGNDQIK